MGKFSVKQRTSDGFFNFTDLVKQWNQATGQNKRIEHYFENASTKEFLKALFIDNYESPEKRGFKTIELSDSYELTKEDLKTLYVTARGGKGENRGATWMTPIMYIDACMWLNPAFKVKVIKFVYDEMIRYRHEAGDEYRKLGSAIGKIVPADFMKTAMKKIGEALNWIIFNEHESGIRNRFGDERKQRELSQLERKVADLINEGFISDYKEMISYLRKLYQQKNYPKVFIQ
jgi:hypothetical protein